ncbi:hypothetical protein B0H13DRAFT_2357079 [Mycena leptocephala]|nr:hypothetical protein B0H13DRAFT_2357079 [Mycena leptocephala]
MDLFSSPTQRMEKKLKILLTVIQEIVAAHRPTGSLEADYQAFIKILDSFDKLTAAEQKSALMEVDAKIKYARGKKTKSSFLRWIIKKPKMPATPPTATDKASPSVVELTEEQRQALGDLQYVSPFGNVDDLRLQRSRHERQVQFGESSSSMPPPTALNGANVNSSFAQGTPSALGSCRPKSLRSSPAQSASPSRSSGSRRSPISPSSPTPSIHGSRSVGSSCSPIIPSSTTQAASRSGGSSINSPTSSYFGTALSHVRSNSTWDAEGVNSE